MRIARPIIGICNLTLVASIFLFACFSEVKAEVTSPDIIKSSDKLEVRNGETFTYSIKVINASDAKNAVITDVLSDKVDVVQLEQGCVLEYAGGYPNQQIVSCNLSDIAGDVEKIIDITVRANLSKIVPIFNSLYQSNYHYEPIAFSLKNNSAIDLYIDQRFPWQVVDTRGNVLFTQENPENINLSSGEEKKWSWDQKDQTGQYVSAGNYSIIFPQFNSDIPIQIFNKEGSNGFFLFQDSFGKTVNIFMTNPVSIRDAIESYYSLGIKSIPGGNVIIDNPDTSPYDPQWHWHFDPYDLRMGERWTEWCDMNLDQFEQTFGRGRKGSTIFYCPWGIKPIKLLN